MLRNFYAFAEIDRAGHRRRDAAWLSERLAHADTRFLPVWRNQNLVDIAAEAAARRLSDRRADRPRRRRDRAARHRRQRRLLRPRSLGA